MSYRDDTLSSRRITYVLSPLPEVDVILPRRLLDFSGFYATLSSAIGEFLSRRPANVPGPFVIGLLQGSDKKGKGKKYIYTEFQRKRHITAKYILDKKNSSKNKEMTKICRKISRITQIPCILVAVIAK